MSVSTKFGLWAMLLMILGASLGPIMGLWPFEPVGQLLLTLVGIGLLIFSSSRKIAMWMKIIIALLLSIFVGLLLGDQVQAWSFKLFGDIFLRMISMLVVLLVFSSMTVGITSMKDPKKLGRVGIRSLLLYLSTTLVAVCLGLILALTFKPGAGVNMSDLLTLSSAQQTVVPSSKTLTISEMVLAMFPANPIEALTNGNVLQIIVFSLFFGIAINLVGSKAKPVRVFLESLSDTMFRLTTLVMTWAPYGVFAMMTWVVGFYGVDALMALVKFLMICYAGSLIHILVVFTFGILFLGARLSPWPFFKGMADAIMFAFSTSSSAATLPVSLHCVEKNLGVSNNIASFVLPLGSTVNMNGAALGQAVMAVFIAQAYGIVLTVEQLIILVVSVTMSAIGAAGIPGSSVVMLSMVLSAVGLPLEGIALVVGVNWLREMVSTVLNILGDASVAVWVAKSEGELDVEQYNHAAVIGYEESDV